MARSIHSIMHVFSVSSSKEASAQHNTKRRVAIEKNLYLRSAPARLAKLLEAGLQHPHKHAISVYHFVTQQPFFIDSVGGGNPSILILQREVVDNNDTISKNMQYINTPTRDVNTKLQTGRQHYH